MGVDDWRFILEELKKRSSSIAVHVDADWRLEVVDESNVTASLSGGHISIGRGMEEFLSVRG